VGFILEGTVRWDRGGEGPGRVRITPQLVRVADDTHLWTDRYDRVLNDIFAAQSEIAAAVAEQLGLVLLPREQAALATMPTESMEAYQAYLRGLEHWSQGRDAGVTRESHELAARSFERAVELDPDFVEAHALLAQARISLSELFERTPESRRRAREAVDRALALGPDSPEARLALGRYSERVEGDEERALEEYTLVAERHPNDSVARGLLARVLMRRGRMDEATVLLEKALELDPGNVAYTSGLCVIHRLHGRYREAERLYDRAITLRPERYELYTEKAGSYFEEGRLDRMRATLESIPVVDAYGAYQVAYELELRARDYQAALDRLSVVRREALNVLGVGFVEVEAGKVRALMGQPDRARESWEAAVAVLEKAVATDANAHAQVRLVLAYAGLGRKGDAIRAGDRLLEMSPISSDGVGGTGAVVLVAQAYAHVGEHERALELLESLASIPSWMSYGYLRYEPWLDPLRDDPRFQRLLADKKSKLPPP